MVHVVANKESNKEFILPVTWQVFSKIKVQANSLSDAFRWANEHLDEIPLGDDADYVDGSYEISAESPEECELYNTKKSQPEMGKIVQLRVTDIKWTVDELAAESLGLPETVIVPDEYIYRSDDKFEHWDSDDTISDWLSDKYEFCHEGFSLVYLTENDLKAEEEKLKRAINDAGVDAVEEFLGHLLDSDDIDIEAEMNDVIAQMPDEEYVKYLVKYCV